MAITPEINGLSLRDGVTITGSSDRTTRTYAIDWRQGTVRGYIDGKAAMEQAIYKVLLTARFKFLIYSWNYGFEMDRVLNKSTPVVNAIIGRLLKDCLLQDSRILDLVNLTTTIIDKNTIGVFFIAQTIFGNIEVSKNIDWEV